MHYMYAAVARVRRAFRNDEGATAVEYGLMVALIAAAIAGIVYTLGQSLNTKFGNVNTCVNNAPNCNSQGQVGQ
ncbi:MAG TPA: Flp family type IVb pilin [Mycobacteriales bacterium]|nr:Flp family type IVb pilin [Mycobacteriales bacterium]